MSVSNTAYFVLEGTSH